MKAKFLLELDDSLSTEPRHYASPPFSLVWRDILLIFLNLPYVVYIAVPFWPWPSEELDEFYPSLQNLIAMALHLLLIILQVAFIISLPMCLWFPLVWVLLYIAAFFVLNNLICEILNGRNRNVHVSKTNLSMFPKRENERWIYLNGIATGYALKKLSSLHIELLLSRMWKPC
jgi:hypothetical protein